MNIDQSSHQQKWSAGLFNCGENPLACCITFFVPYITFGQIAEVLDEGENSCECQGLVYWMLMMIQCHWLYSCTYREKLRRKFGLPYDPCCDCCVHCFCEPCALRQEYAELRNRGFDPRRGWIDPSKGMPLINAMPPMPPSMNR